MINDKMLRFFLSASILYVILFSYEISLAKTFYLDSSLTSCCISGNYSAVNRNCSGSDGNAYNNLQDAINNLAGGDTLYVRNGTYIRTTNHIKEGSLHITVSGSAGQHTVVREYQSEQPIICTETGRCRYNPKPGDTSVTVCHGYGGEGGSACYYPNPAIRINGNYIDLKGFKTYGQVVVTGHDVTVQNSDLGGGGPTINQGQVVFINSAYNVTIKNNKIHHSCWGESNANGAAIMGYDFSAIIENNEFYDTWATDISYKDAGSQTGRTTEVRNNFFKPSTIFTSAGTGVGGISQDPNVDSFYVHNNIFYKKRYGFVQGTFALTETVVYNNTFIDCTYDIYSSVLRVNEPGHRMYNNLYYHTDTAHYYLLVDTGGGTADVHSDYNMYYGTQKWKTGTPNYSTWASWQAAGYDTNGLYGTDPNFVNVYGSTPEAFKRTSYTENFTGSSYGVHAGAYEDGTETIGIHWSNPTSGVSYIDTGINIY